MAINPRARRRRHDPPRSWHKARSAPPPDSRGRSGRRPGDSETSSRSPRGAARPDAAARPRPTPAAPPWSSAGLDAAIEAFTARWDRGEAVRAEEYVGLLPVVDAAELIYHEYCLAEAARLAPEPADFLRRFPDHSAVLSRLFSLHGALSVATLGRLAGPADLPEAGDSIGPYRLLRELGRGAFARVFLAEQADLGDRLVVVKVSTRPTAEPTLLARARHAHIVEVLRHAEADDGALHLVCMPFLGGATLAAVLDARRKAPTRRLRAPRSGRDLLALLDRASAPEYPATDLPRPAREVIARLSCPKAVAWMVARLADALDHAERRGVTHGDIKPSNILIAADGAPMLFDFNLAVDWHADDELHRGVDLGGTLAYMAPERLRAIAAPDRPVDPVAAPRSRRQPDRHRADLYALGLVLAEALTGDPPATPDRDSTDPRSFAAALADRRAASARVQPALRSRSIPPALRAILARCLAPEPTDRYARGGELAADLDRWRSDRPLTHAPEPARAAWGRKVRSLRFPLAAVALTALVAGGVALAATRIMEGTRRDQAMAKWDYILDHTEGIFKVRRAGQWQSTSVGEPAEVATHHLARYNAEADPLHWREQGDVRALPDRERGEVEAWVLEQVLRKAIALADRPDSRQDWERADFLLARAMARCPASAFRDLRATLRDRLGPAPASAPAPAEPTAPPPPAWLDAYLTGVAAEPLHAREALGHYLDALRDRPDLFWGHYRAAVVACRIDEYRVAFDHLRACVARRPRSEVLRTQLANIRFRLEQEGVPGSSLADQRDAQAECDQALSLNPDFAEAHFTRTFVRRAAGQTEGVQADIDRYAILTRSVNLAQALQLRFSATYGSESSYFTYNAENEAILREAIRQEPAEETSRINLAISLDQAGRRAEATELYDQLIAANPHHLWARYLRAMLERTVDQSRAIAEFVRLIDHPRFEETFRQQPSAIRAYHYVATDFLNRGQTAEAEAVARRSLAVIDRSHSLQNSVISARVKGQEKLDPRAETYYLLARIIAVAARTEPKRWSISVNFLREAFALQPSFRQDWFANDRLFRPHSAAILEKFDREVDEK